MSYLIGIYLELWFSWLWGGVQKTLKKRRIQQKKNIEKWREKKWRIQGKSNSNNEHLWFYLLHKNYILLKNMVWKKVVYTITFYLQFLCVTGYSRRNSNTPKLNIHKYNNYYIIEIYINRLSTTTRIFIAMDYFILMSEKYVHFRKRHVARNFFPSRRSNWIHVLRKYFPSRVYLKDVFKNLKEIGIIQVIQSWQFS